MNSFPKGAISNPDLLDFQAAYASCPNSRLLTNALYKLNINDLAFSGEALAAQNFVFSTEIKTLPSLTQKNTGRCWLFAATNCLREIIAKEKNLEDFELSQSWLAFWDKFERANFFLESILATANLDLDDRTVAFILTTGVQDGGQWDMFVNIVKKYGLCPKTAFPETAQSSATYTMNQLLNMNLKKDAVVLRTMAARKASELEINVAKAKMMSDIYSFLTTCYGKPPATFDFEAKDKDGNYFREEAYTPFTFRDKYFGNMLDDYVSIINAPTQDKPFDKTYTVDFLGNVAEAAPIKYLNLPIQDFKARVIKQLQDGELVWFGSDCGKFGERTEKNLWDPALYEYEPVTGLDLTMTKAEMLDYHYSAMNHAMVITGVNIVNDKPTRWKIENSWGKEGPNKGYFFMSDTWFDAFVYQAVINKKYLTDKLDILAAEPIILKPWDPMGTLAD